MSEVEGKASGWTAYFEGSKWVQSEPKAKAKKATKASSAKANTKKK
jgi:DNA topoisomerase-1